MERMSVAKLDCIGKLMMNGLNPNDIAQLTDSSYTTCERYMRILKAVHAGTDYSIPVKETYSRKVVRDYCNLKGLREPVNTEDSKKPDKKAASGQMSISDIAEPNPDDAIRLIAGKVKDIALMLNSLGDYLWLYLCEGVKKDALHRERA